jgi:D-beta-D-heptose 7-phosphate kinase/D-beta-D-heptose 1-phosphate adenosyltransferase
VLSNAELQGICARFDALTVGVVGDLMADRFVYGDAERLSPEAPVPVVRITRRETMPGGAANVAVNIARLGGRFRLFGVLGDDGAAGEVTRFINELGGDCAGIVTDPGRPTTVKTRIVARSQHLLRYDYETDQPVAAPIEQQLLQRFREALDSLDVVVISDYAKGLFHDSFAERVLGACADKQTKVLVDPKPVNAAQFSGAYLVKPNLGEALRLAGRERKAPPEEMRQVCLEVEQACGVDNVVITAGNLGMFVHAAGEFRHLPGFPREVFDVAGAGDTTMAAIALGVAAEADVFSAARLGNLAGSIAVGKLGTAAVSRDELVAELGDAEELDG